MLRRKWDAFGPIVPQYNFYSQEQKLYHEGYLMRQSGQCHSCRNSLYRDQYTMNQVTNVSSQPILYRPFNYQDQINLSTYFPEEK